MTPAARSILAFTAAVGLAFGLTWWLKARHDSKRQQLADARATGRVR